MGFRFYKSVSVGRGVRMSVSKSGLGLSAGVPGFRYSVHSSGRTRKTTSIPGTGLSYQTYGRTQGGRKRTASHTRTTPTPTDQARATAIAANSLKAPLFAPRSEKSYVKGVKWTLRGQYQAAVKAFQECLADDPSAISAYFLAAYSLIKLGDEKGAIPWLDKLVQSDQALPDPLMQKHRLDGTFIVIIIPLSITPLVQVEIEMGTIGAALLLAELYQEHGRLDLGIGLLENLISLAAEVPAIALSLGELYVQASMWDELSSMPISVKNTDDLSAEVLRYKARGLRERGMNEGALELLREALRSKKRHPEILKASRYERALTYEALGKRGMARKDFERMYADDPSYMDVGARLQSDDGVRKSN